MPTITCKKYKKNI